MACIVERYASGDLNKVIDVRRINNLGEFPASKQRRGVMERAYFVTAAGG